MPTKTEHDDTGLDNWVTTTEASKHLGVSPQYVRDLVTKGTLEGRWVSNRLLINRGSLGNWQPQRRGRRGKPAKS